MFDVNKNLMFELILWVPVGSGSDFKIMICWIRSRIRPKLDWIRNPALCTVVASAVPT